MYKSVIAGLFTGMVAVLPASAADGSIDCTCVANGERIELGQVICLRPGSNEPFLARCERVLNNTSWKRLQDGCPTASSQSLRSESGNL